VFDGLNETWSAIASMPGGQERQYSLAFSDANFGYILGGINCANVCLNDFWRYSPLTNTWTALPNCPSQGKQGMSCFVIGSKVLVIGGRLSNGVISNEVWEYDLLLETWVQKNNLPFAGSFRGAAFAINGIGYCCYGLTNNGNFNRLIYSYNQINDTWLAIPNVSLPARNYIGCAVTSNKAFLYGGQDSLFQITNDVYLFDPLISTLTIHSGIPTLGRRGGMAFSLNNKFYFTTGVDTSPARIKETWKNDQFVGITEYNKSTLITIYPNPLSENDVIKIKLEVGQKPEACHIKLISPLGTLIREEQIEFIDGVAQIETTDLPNGIYTMQLSFLDTAPFPRATPSVAGGLPQVKRIDNWQITKKFVIAR